MGDLWKALDKVLTSGGCLSFLVSVLSPFLTVTYFTIIPELNFRLTYWSFQALIIRDGLYPPASENVYFDRFWFAQGKQYSYLTLSDMGISMVFVSMFLVQVATLFLGIISLFMDGRRQAFALFLSSLSLFFLMVYVISQFSSRTYCLPAYEPGFWFTILSVSLFLAACTLRSMAKRKQIDINERELTVQAT